MQYYEIPSLGPALGLGTFPWAPPSQGAVWGCLLGPLCGGQRPWESLMKCAMEVKSTIVLIVNSKMFLQNNIDDEYF